jgi:hypothetical protein
MRYVYTVFIKKEKTPLGRPSRECKENIKLYLKERVYGRIQVAQGSIHSKLL